MDNTLNFSEIIKRLRIRFKEGLTRGVDFRIRQLNSLKQMILENREELVQSVRADFKKPVYEINLEIDYTASYINYTIKNIHYWVAPTNIPKDYVNMLNTVQIRKEPLGVILIMTHWNYSILLPMCILAGAISSGNCALVRPSEMTPTIALKLRELTKQYLSNNHYEVICGGSDMTVEVLQEKFDHILYLGNEPVGRMVLEAAAKHITPVTVECDGKCPCYVDKNCDLELAAKKIASVKTLNAGQICMTVDYVMCHQDVQDKLVELIQKYWIQFYDENPERSEDYGRMINKEKVIRLRGLVQRSKGKIVVGGNFNEEDCYVSPTLLINVEENDSLMSEEIYGPILPIVTVRNCQEAIAIIQKLNKPIAVYIMTTSTDVVEKMSDETSSGEFIVNDIYGQLLVSNFPAGGVGSSGYGKFLGRSTFDSFSNPKAFYRKKYYLHKFEDAPLPPMDEKKYNTLKWYL